MRQQQNLQLRIGEVTRDFDLQRRQDLVQVEQGFGRFETQRQQMLDAIRRVSLGSSAAVMREWFAAGTCSVGIGEWWRHRRPVRDAASRASARCRAAAAPRRAPSHAAGRPSAAGQQAADARYKVRVMEGVLEKSVQQAALRLNEQLQRVSPDLIQLAGAAHARGYRLEGYGLFFDVEVPAAMRQTMGWTARVMRQQHEGVSEALGSLKRIAGELDPQGARRRGARDAADRAGRPAGAARPPARPSGRWSPAPPPGGGDGRRRPRRWPRRRRPLPTPTSRRSWSRRRAEAPTPPLWRSPDLAYEDQVREALIGAMLDWGALLPLGPDEWLTVAARDNQDVVMPGAAPDVVTIILRVKGSDLAERLAGRLPTDELRRRVEVREF